jgi:hypothetical protein
MGLQTLPALSEQLQAHGMAPGTPCVAVERGTTARQRVAYGCVGDLCARATALGLRSPTLIIIGEVVALSAGWAAWEAEGRPVATAPQQQCARLLAPDATRVLASVAAAVAAGDAATVAGAAA